MQRKNSSAGKKSYFHSQAARPKSEHADLFLGGLILAFQLAVKERELRKVQWLNRLAILLADVAEAYNHLCLKIKKMDHE
jgi:hypothetical protein